MIDTTKTIASYEKEGVFLSAPQVKSNFFITSLFTRVSDHGILYSAPVNYRSARSENLTSRSEFSNSMLDHALSSASRNIFSTNPLNVFFFQEKDFSGQKGGQQKYNGGRMTSMAKETLKIGGTTINDVTVQFKNVGVFPSEDQLLKVAYILNVKVAGATAEELKLRMLDFAPVLTKYRHFIPDTYEHLEKLVRDQFQWKFFGLKGWTLCQNMWRI